jgi:hypothetical protein
MTPDNLVFLKATCESQSDAFIRPYQSVPAIAV